ncbi:MAG: caspase family protein [Hyphomicrobiaceae bacterium]
MHRLLAAVLVLWVVWPAVATAERRLALVVGNDSYESLPKLSRARADADAVGRALEAIGFEVLVAKDASRRELNRRMADLEAKIAPGDTAFFFFAGHGVAIGSDNILLPVDLPKPRSGEESLVREEGTLVDSIVQRLQARGATTTFLVLDACRDNPFSVEGTRSIGQSRGLTRIEAPRGVFVLYSAGIGQTALDTLSRGDTAANSVFTRQLVPLLGEPGLTHVDLAKRVQSAVDKLAASIGHQQQPAYYDQIVGEFVLNTAPKAPDANAVLAEAAKQWPAIARSTDATEIEAFIAQFGTTAFGDLARRRLANLEPPRQQQAVAAIAATPEAGKPTLEAASPAADPKLLAREVQQVLAEKRCYSGRIDGDWGRRSIRAVEDFNRAASLELPPDAPTPTTLASLKQSGAICAEGGAIAPEATTETAPSTVTSGSAPKAGGKSKSATKPKSTSKTKTTQSSKSTTSRKAATKSQPAAKKKSGGNCFTFNGQTVCD